MTEEKEQTKSEESTDIDEQKLLRKLDLHLVPCLTILFLLSLMDRSNGDSHPLSADPSLTPPQSETLV